MQVLKEANNEAVDWRTMPAWAEQGMEEAINEGTELTEDKYTDIEVGTCFKLAAKPAVYEILRIENDGEVVFQSYKHPYGNWWKTTYNYLKHLVEQGDFIILSEHDLQTLMEY